MDKNETRYFLTEAMGECCPKFFKKYGYHKQIDFLTWEGFGKLFKWAMDQDWWDTFALDNGRCNDNFEMFIDERLIDPEAFAKAVVGYLQKK